MIFFDHNSTTNIANEALEKINEFSKLPLNSSATHQLGQKANGAVEEARGNLRKILNGDNYEVIFTSGATEAANLVFFGTKIEKIIFSKIEHASIYNCRPENKEIIEIEALENGLIDIVNFEKKLQSIDSQNFMVAVSLANNETGAIQDVEKIAKLTHQKGGLVYCDIVQAIGKISINLESLNVDFASISSHKMGGPQGVGALMMRKGLDIRPIIFGGGQEKGKRSGTLNVAGIAGFGQACKLIEKRILKSKEIAGLRDYLEEKMQEVALEKIKIFAKEVDRLTNTSYFSVENSDNQTALIHFDLNGICVSGGAACSSGTLSESRVLKAMGISDKFLKGAIRVSFGVDNKKQEVDKFIKVWSEFFNKKNN